MRASFLTRYLQKKTHTLSFGPANKINEHLQVKRLRSDDKPWSHIVLAFDTAQNAPLNPKRILSEHQTIVLLKRISLAAVKTELSSAFDIKDNAYSGCSE